MINDFFQFWKTVFNTDFLKFFFNAAIDKTDVITAKKVRHTCSLVPCVKCSVCNKTLLSTFHFLLSSSLLQLLTVTITLPVHGEVSSSRFHPPSVQATCFLPLLFAFPSFPTPQATRTDKDSLHLHRGVPQPRLSEFCDKSLSEQNAFDRWGECCEHVCNNCFVISDGEFWSATKRISSWLKKKIINFTRQDCSFISFYLNLKVISSAGWQ